MILNLGKFAPPVRFINLASVQRVLLYRKGVYDEWYDYDGPLPLVEKDGDEYKVVLRFIGDDKHGSQEMEFEGVNAHSLLRAFNAMSIGTLEERPLVQEAPSSILKM